MRSPTPQATAEPPTLEARLETVRFTPVPIPAPGTPGAPDPLPEPAPGEPLASVLLPYQARWVSDPSDVKVAEKSRRVGLTWAEAFDDVMIAASARDAGGQNVYYLGPSREMALEYVQTCAQWARAIDAGARELETGILEDEDKQIQVYRIRFPSDFAILALSSRPSNLRGRQGVVVIDEAAFHPDVGGMLKAAFALLIWGGKVRVISTHDGIDNPFNTLVVDVRTGKVPYALHRITFDEALRDGLGRRALAKQGKPWSPEAERAWRDRIYAIYRDNAGEELDVVPASGSGTYLSAGLIESRMAEAPIARLSCDDAYQLLPADVRRREVAQWCARELAPLLARCVPAWPSYLGFDFARTNHLSVAWPVQVRPDLKRVTPFLVELRNVPHEDQRQIAEYLMDGLPRFSAAKFDAGGNGSYVAESAVQRYGEAVEAVQLSPAWYAEHGPPLKAALEDDLFEVPRHADILADLRQLKLVNGIPRVPKDAEFKGSDGRVRHADAAVAALLVYAASRADPVAYGYTPVPRADAWGDAPRDGDAGGDADDAGASGGRGLRRRGSF